MNSSDHTYQQAVIQHLAAQRTATADQLAHVNGMLAVAQARIAELEAEVKALRAQATSPVATDDESKQYAALRDAEEAARAAAARGDAFLVSAAPVPEQPPAAAT